MRRTQTSKDAGLKFLSLKTVPLAPTVRKRISLVTGKAGVLTSKWTRVVKRRSNVTVSGSVSVRDRLEWTPSIIHESRVWRDVRVGVIVRAAQVTA